MEKKELDSKNPVDALEILFAATENFGNFSNNSVRQSHKILAECKEVILKKLNENNTELHDKKPK